MTITLRQAATFIGAACFVAVMAAGGGLGAYYMAPQSPVMLKDVHVVNSVVYRGRTLVLKFSIVRLILCDSKVDRWLWRYNDDGKPLWEEIPASNNPPTPIGIDVEYELALPVPPTVTKGRWNYFSRSWDACPGPFGLVYRTVRDSGNVPVDIEDPPQSAPMQIITPPGPVVILPTTN